MLANIYMLSRLLYDHQRRPGIYQEVGHPRQSFLGLRNQDLEAFCSERQAPDHKTYLWTVIRAHDIFCLVWSEVENLSNVKEDNWRQGSRRYVEWDMLRNEISQGSQMLILFPKGPPLTDAIAFVKYEVQQSLCDSRLLP